MTKLVAFGERVDLDVLIAAFGHIAEPPEVPHTVYICSCANPHPGSGPSGPTAPVPYGFVPLPFDFDFR